MADFVTGEQLENASKNCDSFDLFFHGSDTEDVITYLGKVFPTLSKVLRLFFDVGLFRPFQTEAQLLAYVPVTSPSAAYAFDTKKLYLWNGTSWIDEGLSPLDISKTYTGEQFEALAKIVTSGNLSGLSIGSLDETGATLNNVPAGTYVLNQSVSAGTVIRKISLNSKLTSGSVKIKVYTLAGSTFTLARTISTLNVSKVGINEFNNLNIVLNAGEYLGFSVEASGVVAYINKTTALPSYYTNSNPNATSFANTGAGSTALLQIKYQQFPSLEPLAAIFYDLDSRIDVNKELIDRVVKTQRYGVQQTPSASNQNASSAQWIPARATQKSGKLYKFQTYANIAGKIQIGAYVKSGTTFTRQRFVELNVVVGLNIFDIDLDIKAGEYVGLRTYDAGLTTYITTSTGHDGVYSTTSLADSATYTTNPNMSYAFQFCADQLYFGDLISDDQEVSDWFNKVLSTFGDSITWYYLQTFVASHIESGQICVGYQSAVKEMLGCIIDNHGRSGWTMPQIYVGEISVFNFANTYATTITSGANDCRTGVDVGQIAAIGSQFDKTTYAGALQASIEHVISSNPACKIFLITPIRGWYNEYNTSDVPNPDPNVVGLMNEAYANIMKEIGKLYGVPVLDWYNLTGLNELNKFYYLGDNPQEFDAYLLHPKNIFFRIMGIILANFLKKYG